MKYSGWGKAEMIGELILRGMTMTSDEARKATKNELLRKLKETEPPPGCDWEEPDSETGRF